MSRPLGSSSNLVITLGIFLKLLGFFVVMFSYSEFVPSKVSQAEESLSQRFNMHISIHDARSGDDDMTTAMVQNAGRAFELIETDLKTQIDLFSVEKNARSRELVMLFPAEQVLHLGGDTPKSQNFPATLIKTLQQNKPKNFAYDVQVTGMGGQSDKMMRGLGGFAQDMVADGYPERLVTIGYDDDADQSGAFVRFQLTMVPQ